MVWEKLKEELIIPGLEAKSSDDIFEALGGKLVKQGYCKESYVQALKANSDNECVLSFDFKS